MKKLLCFFVVALSLCIYPIFLRVPIEISHVFGLVEIDVFSWYRMWLVAISGIALLLGTKEESPKVLLPYLVLVMLSAVLSTYQRTSFFGAPWTHEGVLAILGYVGIYLAASEYGLFPELEKALDVVVVVTVIVSALQIIYGNPLYCPLINWVLPAYKYDVGRWPLYSVFGSSNHLGLFCSLFFPYTVLKKKYVLSGFVLWMAICSETRGAWLSIAVTSILMGKRTAAYVALSAVLIAIPFHKEVIPRIKNTLDELHTSSEAIFDGRGHLWKKSIPQLKETILLGHGPGNFGMRFPQHQHFDKKTVVDRPHNEYLNIWISTGLISLLLILGGIFQILWAADQALEMEFGVIGLLIASLFTDSVLSVTPYFLIFLGCLNHKKDWSRV